MSPVDDPPGEVRDEIAHISCPSLTHADSASHRPSHLRIIQELTVPADGRLDRIEGGGIVLPAYRSFDREPGLQLATQLAQQLGWALLVICSGRAHAVDFPDEIRRALGDRLTVIDRPAAVPSMELSSLRHPLVRLERSNDAAVKRNLGIAAAVRAGWRYLLFLDDDVITKDDDRTLDKSGIDAAVTALQARSNLRAISWTVEEFPDNSVIGHARRLAGKEQTIFVGSAALLVRCDERLPFFPGVYNEDWMFLIALAQASSQYGQCIARAGSVRQLQYDPYSSTRAMSEEPGDIIAEGLMNLLEDDGPALWAVAGTPAYWRRAVARRSALINDLIRSLELTPDVESARRARTALNAALRLHRSASPESLRNYVLSWRADLPRWQAYLEALAARRDGADLGTVVTELTTQSGTRAGAARPRPGVSRIRRTL